jgi:RNA polymerase sigma factor (sigma-70 family)
VDDRFAAAPDEIAASASFFAIGDSTGCRAVRNKANIRRVLCVMGAIMPFTSVASDRDRLQPVRADMTRSNGRGDVANGGTGYGATDRKSRDVEGQDFEGKDTEGQDFQGQDFQGQDFQSQVRGGGIDVQGGKDEQRARFANLIFPYLSDAYALARSLTGNHVDAEDVVQEACLRAFRAIGGVADKNARAWLLTIVYNTACTWLGRNRSKTIIAVEDLELIERSQSLEQDTQTPETALMAKVDGKRLEAAIGTLPLAYKETLLLRELEGLDYRQIAEITGVPIGTVMSRLARARRRVITILETQAP